MDKDFIAAIVGVVFAAFLGWLEHRAKRKGSGSKPEVQPHKLRKTALAHPPSGERPHRQNHRPISPKPTHMRAASSPEAVHAQARSTAAAASPFLDSSAEGAPQGGELSSTKDMQRAVQPTPMPDSGLNAPTAKQLREAVVWSEILRRKF